MKAKILNAKIRSLINEYVMHGIEGMTEEQAKPFLMERFVYASKILRDIYLTHQCINVSVVQEYDKDKTKFLLKRLINEEIEEAFDRIFEYCKKNSEDTKEEKNKNGKTN